MTLPHSTNILDYPARYQFQTNAPCGGSSCCTDCVIQMIVEYYKEKTYSLSYIRKVAQAKTSFNESPCTGINYIEVLNALNTLGVTHYRYGSNVSASTVLSKTAIGPVLVGVWYGNYPNSVRGTCGEPHASHAGRTDCGFKGSHAVLALRKDLYNGGTSVLTRDPDHHSAARPEHPTFDRITLGQLSNTMLALPRNTAFSSTYCIYPTRRKTI